MHIFAHKYVILGGGVVAGYAAQEFVRQGIVPGELSIISADELAPYDRPSLSKSFLAGRKTEDDLLINPLQFYAEHDIEVLLNTRVTQVDLHGGSLQTAGGDEHRFEKLLIATGAVPHRLSLPGADLPGVHVLRSVAQSAAIAQEAAGAQHAVIIGSGFLGLEVASVLAGRGLQVTVVTRDDALMPRLYTPDMAAFFQGYYEDHGVRFHFHETASRFDGGERVEQVTLGSGETLPADLVVVAVGVGPATDLFQATGLPLDNGVIVNKYLETNRDGVFAAGDVANYYDVIFQKRRRDEHWDSARAQGEHAARMMLAGRKRDEYMHLRYFFSDFFDLSYDFWGDTSRADRVVQRGDMSTPSFSVWWLEGNRVDAAFIMNRPDEERELAPRWIKSRRRVLPEELLDADKSLAEMIPALG